MGVDTSYFAHRPCGCRVAGPIGDEALFFFTTFLYVFEKHTTFLSTELKIFQVFWEIFRFLKEIRRFFGNFEDF